MEPFDRIVVPLSIDDYTSSRVLAMDYPGIAMLLFLAAAAGGCWMAWTILAGDLRRIKDGRPR
jgi:hypothetical protein